MRSLFLHLSTWRRRRQVRRCAHRRNRYTLCLWRQVPTRARQENENTGSTRGGNPFGCPEPAGAPPTGWPRLVVPRSLELGDEYTHRGEPTHRLWIERPHDGGCGVPRQRRRELLQRSDLPRNHVRVDLLEDRVGAVVPELGAGSLVRLYLALIEDKDLTEVRRRAGSLAYRGDHELALGPPSHRVIPDATITGKHSRYRVFIELDRSTEPYKRVARLVRN
jgi:hypothetical protein